MHPVDVCSFNSNKPLQLINFSKPVRHIDVRKSVHPVNSNKPVYPVDVPKPIRLVNVCKPICPSDNRKTFFFDYWRHVVLFLILLFFVASVNNIIPFTWTSN